MSNLRPFVRKLYRAKGVGWPVFGRRDCPRHDRRPRHSVKPRPGGLWRLWQLVTRQKEPLG
jgi:hypothetical protein